MTRFVRHACKRLLRRCALLLNHAAKAVESNEDEFISYSDSIMLHRGFRRTSIKRGQDAVLLTYQNQTEKRYVSITAREIRLAKDVRELARFRADVSMDVVSFRDIAA